MKILLTAYCVSPVRGSEPGTSWRTASALADLGHEVVLVTSGWMEEEVAGARIPEQLRIVRARSTPPAALNRGRVGTYLRYFLWMRRAARVASALIESEEFDVAHHLSWGSLPWGTPVDGRSVPLVIGPIGGGQQLPGSFAGELSRPERLVQQLRRCVVRLSRFNPRARSAAARASVSLATNSASGAMLRAAGASVVEPFLADVTPESFLESDRPGFESRNDTVVWVGRLLPLKAASLALKTLAQMDDAVRLVIVGDGPDRSHLEDLARRLGVESRVDFAGHLPWTEVRAVFDSAKVMLFTSLRDSSGPQLLEAGARGVPIVAIRHHGAGEWVPPAAGSLVEPTTPQETVVQLARKVGQLMNDQGVWTMASKASVEFALDHLVERHAAQFLEIYAAASSVRAAHRALDDS